MIFILLLHVTDVFAMLVESQTTTESIKEATFESYEGEPVFGDPQHKQYEVADFWWDRPTSKWVAWWDKMNISVSKWYIEQSPSTDDLSKIWQEGMLDMQTSIKQTQKDTTTCDPSRTTETKPVWYKTSDEHFVTTQHVGPIYLISSEEVMNPKHDPSPKSPLRTTRDYILELLTAKSLSFAQQSAAELIALREGPETTTYMSHPSKLVDALPFDSDLFRQLRGETPLSLQKPNPDLTKLSPVFKPHHHKKAVKKVDKFKASGNKTQGLHGWRLQYPGLTTRPVPVNKTSYDIHELKNFIEIHPRETISPFEKNFNHNKTPNSFEKFQGRSLSRSKLATLYETSLKDAEYYNIINDGPLKPVVKLDRSSLSRTFEVNGKFQHSGEPAIRTSNTEPNQYVYMDDQPPQRIQTPLRPIIDPFDPGLYDTVSTFYSSTVNTPPTVAFDEMNIPEYESPPPENNAIALTSTAKIPGNLPADQLGIYDLQEADLSGKPSQATPAGHVREGSIDDTGIQQSFASAITQEPETKSVSSAITQEPETKSVSSAITQEPDSQSVSSAITQEPDSQSVASAITQEPAITVKRILAVAAVSPTFTVPNMETTVTTTEPPMTTAETTKFTLEMPPLPLPNNLPNYDIDWSIFNKGLSTTPLESLLHPISIPEEILTTQHSMIIEMRTEMVEERQGYFTVFMRKFLDIASKKDEAALYALLKAAPSSLDRMNNFNELRGLGRPMWPGIQVLFNYMAIFPLDTLKSYAMLGHMSYKSEQMLHDDPTLHDLNYRVNSLYEVREGEHLINTLIAFEDFPGKNGEISAAKVTEDMFRAILAPWYRSKNSQIMYNVLLDLNDKFTNIEQRYLGGVGGRRNNQQNNDTNEKGYVDIINKRTEDDSYYDDTSEEAIDKFRNSRVIDNIVKHENFINKTMSIRNKLLYSTKHKGTEATHHYNHVHNGETAVENTPKKIQKSYRDSKKPTKITKYTHYGPSKDLNTYISSSIKETRENKLFTNSFKHVNTDTDTGANNKKIRKIDNFYNKYKLKTKDKYGNKHFKNDRIILHNKKTRSNSHDKKKTTSRNVGFSDGSTQPTNDYDAYYYDKHLKVVENTVNMMTISVKSESSNKKNEEYYTYDDSSKADSGEKKVPGKAETNRNNNNKIETTSKNYDLNDRTKTTTNDYDSYDDDMESKTIIKEVLPTSVSPNPPVQSNLRYKKVKNIEDKNAFKNKNIENSNFDYQSSFEVELNKKYQKIYDTKNNAKNNKISQNNVSNDASFTKTKNRRNKNFFVKENISIDVRKNSHQPVKTENKEKIWPHTKSKYIVSDDEPSLKDKFLDFNRYSIQSKNTNILRNIFKNKNILRDESSYSDEEELLKSNLQDNLLHGGRNFTVTSPKNKKVNVIRDISSYSDEEDTLKKNIYKTFT